MVLTAGYLTSSFRITGDCFFSRERAHKVPGIAPVCLFYGKMSWKIWFHVSRMRLPVPPASSSLARHPAVKAPARPIFVVSNIRLIAATAWHMSFLLVIEHGGFRREARAAGQKNTKYSAHRLSLWKRNLAGCPQCICILWSVYRLRCNGTERRRY